MVIMTSRIPSSLRFLAPNLNIDVAQKQRCSKNSTLEKAGRACSKQRSAQLEIAQIQHDWQKMSRRNFPTHSGARISVAAQSDPA